MVEVYSADQEAQKLTKQISNSNNPQLNEF